MTATAIDRVGIVGGGAWGTALAQMLCSAGRDVMLRVRNPDLAREINEQHTNQLYLPRITLDPRIKATTSLTHLGDSDCVLVVTPAQHVRATVRELRDHVAGDRAIVICAKGIERATGKLMSEVAREELGAARLATLSGPSFAIDVARGLPAAVTIACQDEEAGETLAQRLGCRQFRVYWTGDQIGVDIGGAAKNVLAIAAGIVEGKGLGPSAHAGIVTRGFAEIARLGVARGARPETLMGLSGLGDIVLTCGSGQSRNMSLGRALGAGQNLADLLGRRQSVTEGVTTASALVQLARRARIEMPIASAVEGIVDGRLTVDAAIHDLLSRPFRAEQ